MHGRRRQRRDRLLQRRPRRGGLGARPGRRAARARVRAGHAERRPHSSRSSRPPRRARCSAPRSTRRARARSSASRPRSSWRTACAARSSSWRTSRPRLSARPAARPTAARLGFGAARVPLLVLWRVNASSGSICHGSSGPGAARSQRRASCCAHADQLLDELAVEEQVAEQLAVRRALASEQAVEQREVGRAQSLPAAVAVLEHLAREARRSRRASPAR